MTGAELAALIGRQGLMRIKARPGGVQLRMPVQVVDAKRAYGVTRYLITPLHQGAINTAAMGKEWVNASRVQLTEE